MHYALWLNLSLKVPIEFQNATTTHDSVACMWHREFLLRGDRGNRIFSGLGGLEGCIMRSSFFRRTRLALLVTADSD